MTPTYENPANWTEQTNQVLEMHWDYLVGLHQQGIMQVVGRTNYSPGHEDLLGIAIFVAEDENAAQHIMHNDPCLIHGVMTATVHPFNLSLLEGRKMEV